ncbi:N-acyl homoserine lactonase family protein [Amycolatopsis sp. CA-230715]|uniref:N-acyl homoserine lactonase family protein n=1 Tax=Amycolatopsis sp. CA-230715 TaxID=2745196 RepID=UPI001C013804|nr:N-acyl homoserine lactonase family protein [Amycolatopsis sp. CA-230715]QWF85406.1 N-acyl homoserine lactonase [Amycolatopsis sp. CA-230715]
MTEVVSLRVFRTASVRENGLPITVCLLELRDGSHVLVDTGCPASMIDDPAAPFLVTEESHVLGRLRQEGLSAADIATVVVTHFDPDHAGANDAFPGAEFVVQREQYDHACGSGLLRYEWLRAQWDGLRYRLVDGDTTLVPGVDLVASGGHVPGHQSVLVRLPETGPVLIAGDAWLAGSDPDTREISSFDHDERATRASQRALMDLADRERVAMVVYSHDPAQWTALRPAPFAYR